MSQDICRVMSCHQLLGQTPKLKGHQYRSTAAKDQFVFESWVSPTTAPCIMFFLGQRCVLPFAWNYLVRNVKRRFKCSWQYEGETIPGQIRLIIAQTVLLFRYTFKYFGKVVILGCNFSPVPFIGMMIWKQVIILEQPTDTIKVFHMMRAVLSFIFTHYSVFLPAVACSTFTWYQNVVHRQKNMSGHYWSISNTGFWWKNDVVVIRPQIVYGSSLCWTSVSKQTGWSKDGTCCFMAKSNDGLGAYPSSNKRLKIVSLRN